MSNERAYCPECGTANEADASYCENCGTTLDNSVDATAPAAATVAAPAETPAETPAPSRRGPSRKVLGILAVLLVVGGAAYGLASPIKAFLGSFGKDKVATADSVQLPPDPGSEAALKDVPLGPNAAGSPAAIRVATGSGADSAVVLKAARRPVERSANATARATPTAPPIASEGTQVTREQPTTTTTPPEVMAAMREMAKEAAVTGAGPPVVTMRENPVAPAAGRIASGSSISLRSSDQICTDKTRQGARFKSVVQQDIEGANGGRIPRGTVVTFVVDKLKRAAPNQKAEFSIAPESIELDGQSYPLSASVDAVAIKEKSRGLLGALAGAAAAAAAAKAAGGDTKQTVGGGVLGGAAGAAIGSQLKTGEGCIEKNAAIKITLVSDLTLRSM